MREPCDYTCPGCGEIMDDCIDWDSMDLDIDGSYYQIGIGTCPCGVRVRFTDHIRVAETDVEVIE